MGGLCAGKMLFSVEIFAYMDNKLFLCSQFLDINEYYKH